MSRIGYFVVPADTQEELSAMLVRWEESVVNDRQVATQVLSNQLFRYAQERAVSQWCDARPFAHEADFHVGWHLYRKGCYTGNVIMPADCPRAARAIDELAAARGGQDALIQHMTKLALGELPPSLIRDVYVALRTGLATAVELGGALVCADYEPGAERELATVLERDGPWLTEPDEDSFGRPVVHMIPRPERDWVRDAWEDGLLDFDIEPREKARANPWESAYTYHSLYVVPEPHISDIMALMEQSRALSARDPDDLDGMLALDGKAQVIGSEEWQRWLDLTVRGQTSVLEQLQAALREFRPGCVPEIPDGMAFDPVEMRALFAVLADWQASVGGRDAAVAHLTDRAHGRDRDMTEKTYDALFALYQYGASHGCGLIDSPIYGMG